MYQHYHLDRDWHEDCEACWAETLSPENRFGAVPTGTNVEDYVDADISNPPEEVTWMPFG